MIGLWRSWVALLSTKEPGFVLAAFRISTAICVLGIYATMLLPVDLVDVLWIDKKYGGLRTLSDAGWLVTALGGARPNIVHPLFGIGVLAATLMLVGLGGRATAFVTLQVFGALTGINGNASGSYDDLLANGLWLVVLSDSTSTASVDCRLRTGRWTSGASVSSWPRYLIIFQLVLCYWTTGLQKVSAYWTPGGGFGALYYILQEPDWQRFDMHWAAYVYPLTQVGTAVSWFWEVTSPLWLLAFWYRATRARPGRLRAWFNAHDVRSLYAVVGVIFHGILLVLMNVGPFSPVTLAYYLCLYHPDEYRWFIGRFQRRPVISP